MDPNFLRRHVDLRSKMVEDHLEVLKYDGEVEIGRLYCTPLQFVRINKS